MKNLRTVAYLCCLGLIVLAGCSSDTIIEYEVEGVVAAVHEDRQVIDLVHDEIPGYMAAMQMPFPVERPELLEGLRMGDQVNFHLTVTNAAAMLTSIDKLPSYSGLLPAWELENMAGDRHFAEVFFTDVRVPVANRLGEEGDGWKVTVSALANERTKL